MFSLASNENVVPKGQEKYFCEIDCHLPYLVANDIKVNISSEVAGNEYHFTTFSAPSGRFYSNHYAVEPGSVVSNFFCV
jgi:hypothetical protein